MPKIKIADGIIRLGTDRGRRFGFVPELFDGYMWKAGDAVYISVILSKDEGKGNFRDLVARIRALGFAVKIPTPSARMAEIVRKNGYREASEWDDAYGCDVALWVLDPPKEKA
jgi:hypothetical protein